MVADSLKDCLGSDVFNLVRELSKKKDYSEFKLAEALKKEVNETRNLLYRLHSLSLASFVRKKDHKIGWYIYYWTFHDDRVNNFVLGQKKSQLESLRERALKEGKSDFYSCLNKCARLDFDKACDFSFRCPECGELLGREAEGGAKKLDSEMAKINSEIRFLEGLGESMAGSDGSADAGGDANKVKSKRNDKKDNQF